MMKTFHMTRLDYSNKKTTFDDFQFLYEILKIAKFKKIQIFERNLALNYSPV